MSKPLITACICCLLSVSFTGVYECLLVHVLEILLLTALSVFHHEIRFLWFWIWIFKVLHCVSVFILFVFDVALPLVSDHRLIIGIALQWTTNDAILWHPAIWWWDFIVDEFLVFIVQMQHRWPHLRWSLSIRLKIAQLAIAVLGQEKFLIRLILREIKLDLVSHGHDWQALLRHYADFLTITHPRVVTSASIFIEFIITMRYWSPNHQLCLVSVWIPLLIQWKRMLECALRIEFHLTHWWLTLVTWSSIKAKLLMKSQMVASFSHEDILHHILMAEILAKMTHLRVEVRQTRWALFIFLVLMVGLVSHQTRTFALILLFTLISITSWKLMINIELQGKLINRWVINEIVQALQFFITVGKLCLFFSFEGLIFLVNHLLHLMIWIEWFYFLDFALESLQILHGVLALQLWVLLKKRPAICEFLEKVPKNFFIVLGDVEQYSFIFERHQMVLLFVCLIPLLVGFFGAILFLVEGLVRQRLFIWGGLALEHQSFGVIDVSHGHGLLFFIRVRLWLTWAHGCIIKRIWRIKGPWASKCILRGHPPLKERRLFTSMLPLLFPDRLLIDVIQMKLLGQLLVLILVLRCLLAKPKSLLNWIVSIQVSIFGLGWAVMLRRLGWFCWTAWFVLCWLHYRCLVKSLFLLWVWDALDAWCWAFMFSSLELSHTVCQFFLDVASSILLVLADSVKKQLVDHLISLCFHGEFLQTLHVLICLEFSITF